MTEKRSQMVIPLNPTNFFTTVFGALVLGFLYYLSDIPKDIDETKINVRAVQDETSELKEKLERQWPILVEHGQRIQTIEDTRFTETDAQKLSDGIVREIKATLQPIANNVDRNQRDILNIEDDIERVKERIK